jgi:hypothetical protein
MLDSEEIKKLFNLTPNPHPVDYAIGIRNELIATYPEQKPLITALTRAAEAMP